MNSVFLAFLFIALIAVTSQSAYAKSIPSQQAIGANNSDSSVSAQMLAVTRRDDWIVIMKPVDTYYNLADVKNIKLLHSVITNGQPKLQGLKFTHKGATKFDAGMIEFTAGNHASGQTHNDIKHVLKMDIGHAGRFYTKGLSASLPSSLDIGIKLNVTVTDTDGYDYHCIVAYAKEHGRAYVYREENIDPSDKIAEFKTTKYQEKLFYLLPVPCYRPYGDILFSYMKKKTFFFTANESR
eukprot:Nk52_evm5s254 gene=Nk52_evmTU5s254